jgi:hypothetical protein
VKPKGQAENLPLAFSGGLALKLISQMASSEFDFSSVA